MAAKRKQKVRDGCVVIYVKIPVETRVKLDQAAEREERTPSAIVRRALESYCTPVAAE